ncbi:hypothetical protein D7Y13_08925 [Corallococcus praedator]|uniref:Secreted protein n=1 Tax=Corallococcus praedator TaxID=2316724 RepID=A0ABX9QMF2_9BACT|nr:hypothetical protein D7X75_15620 [Corallococcus sp. CA031C]RKI12653.1 hypothetical protein D7Y13_08925 [Corallococcus praedator]
MAKLRLAMCASIAASHSTTSFFVIFVRQAVFQLARSPVRSASGFFRRFDSLVPAPLGAMK